MPSLFVVVTQSECPRLYVSNNQYSEVLRACRAWPFSHTRKSWVFEPKRVGPGSNPDGDPTGCTQLLLTGRVDPIDEVETWQFQLGSALDRIPIEQAILRTQTALDYLQKKMFQYEAKVKEPEITETTGP